MGTIWGGFPDSLTIFDFVGTEKELGKPAGSDLTQGTLTLPAMLLNERYPGNNPIMQLFRSPEKKEYIQLAIDQVRNSDIVDECYRTAKEYCDNACKHLNDYRPVRRRSR
jgi:heptaprenyl diphosphate synthase